MESRTQGSRPRTQKNPGSRPRTALPRTDHLEAKNRNARGQGHRRKCSPEKKGLQKFFQAISKRGKQKKSSQIFCEISGVFLHNFKNKQIPTVVKTDANANTIVKTDANANILETDTNPYYL